MPKKATKTAKKPTPKVKIVVEPEEGIPIPYDDAPQDGATPIDNMKIDANTAALLETLGATPDIDETTIQEEINLLKAASEGKNSGRLDSLPAALGARMFLKQYGEGLGVDKEIIRNALTMKLLELADCGDIKHELRAIELLGKHRDVALFSERSDVNINYNSPEALEAAIKQRVDRLLKAERVLELPTGVELEDELSVLRRKKLEKPEKQIVEGEFTEVGDGDDG